MDWTFEFYCHIARDGFGLKGVSDARLKELYIMTDEKLTQRKEEENKQ